MKLLALKQTSIIKPPLKQTTAGIIEWIAPMSVGVATGKIEAGGILISKNVVATTHWIEDDTVAVLISEKWQKAQRVYETRDDLFLSFYHIKPSVSYQGIPTRTEPLHSGTFLFAYSPLGIIYCFEPIDIKKSKAVRDLEDGKNLKLDIGFVSHTLPIVDRFGYLVGMGIGTSYGECIAQPLILKNHKL